MADQAVGELIRAQSIGATDLFVLEQGGVAKSLTGQILLNWLTSAADGHGGIKRIEKTGTVGLTDTYTITLADTTTFNFTVTNGKSITGIAKTGTSGLVDTYTITYNDGGTDKITVTNGAKGDPGDNAYVWIKYASQEPTEASHSMGDVPDAWMGVYSGNSATAPDDWAQYKWYKIEGRQGDTGAPAALISAEVTYQVSDSGTIIPYGEWTASVPVVAQGKYLWTRTIQQYNTGSPITAYSVSRIGMDGLGSVSSVCNVSPDADGNVELSASDVGALPTTGGDLTGELKMNGQPISGLNEPTGGTQAAPKSYVDKRVPLDGSVPMGGNLAMGGNRITGLAEPEDGGDAATKGYADTKAALPKTASGTVIALSDASSGPLQGLRIYGRTTQDGTPTPEAPVELVSVGDGGGVGVTVAGKNILDLSSMLSTGSSDGVTYTKNADGSYSRTGTATNFSGNIWLLGDFSVSAEAALFTLFPGKTYFIKDCYLYLCESNSAVYPGPYGSYTVDSSKYPDGIKIGGVKSKDFEVGVTYNDIVYPMVSLIDTEWEGTVPHQTLHISTPNGLPGIPVTSGGNYTDADGQQCICDEVDFARGVYVQRIGTIDSYAGEAVSEPYLSTTGALSTGAKVLYVLATPIETPIPADELAAYAALHTNRPNTTVYNDAGAHMDVCYYSPDATMRQEDIRRDIDAAIQSATDYVDSKLKFGGVSMANSVVMEYSLGTSFTDEQSADIRSGKFEKVHVGGYWTINGRKYWAAHADYRLHCGDTELTTHHMLVIPDRSFYNGVMNNDYYTTGAYYGSKMKTSGLADALATVKADFGADHILTHKVLLANAVSNGVSSGWAWYDSQIDLMNEKMVYGSYAWGGGAQNGKDTGADKSQLALFQARPDLITNGENWWLRDVQSVSNFCAVEKRGRADNWGAADSISVRPAFLIY